LLSIVRTALRLTKGYRLHFWDSPYLKWRVETWSGVDAESLDKKQFLAFVWQHRAELFRYLRWASRRGVSQ